MKITLATLEHATAQQVFDQVAEHLLTQGKRSINTLVEWSPGLSGQPCAYRGANGLMCAAGCLIADEEYDICMDRGGSEGWDSLVTQGYAPGTHRALISSLQDLHDSIPPDDWMAALAATAHDYGLSPAVVTNFKVQQ